MSCSLSTIDPSISTTGAARPTTDSSGSIRCQPESAEELLEALLGTNPGLAAAQAAPDRTDRGESVLPRRERPDAGRDARSWRASAERINWRRARAQPGDPGDGPGDPGGAHRPANARGQTTAPGGLRHRQGRAVHAPAGRSPRRLRTASAGSEQSPGRRVPLRGEALPRRSSTPSSTR